MATVVERAKVAAMRAVLKAFSTVLTKLVCGAEPSGPLLASRGATCTVERGAAKCDGPTKPCTTDVAQRKADNTAIFMMIGRLG